MPKKRSVHACRLFVILARRAPVGVIFRRGPAKWTQLIRWNTATDVFEMGQWFKGALYERRCDFSPSGERLIYFAAKHHLRGVDPAYTSTWTAISKPPYLTALALWPNGGTTYHGGGLFADEDTVWLNSYVHRWSNPERSSPARAHPSHTPPSDVLIMPVAFTSGDQLFPLRLVRDGWKLMTPGNVEEDGGVAKGRLVRSPERQPHRIQLDFDYQTAQYALLEHAGKNAEKDAGKDPLDGASWADWDQQGRLVFAKDGKLFGARAIGRPELELLADFNGHKPARITAPERARTWR